jgi:hypothetical protein
MIANATSRLTMRCSEPRRHRVPGRVFEIQMSFIGIAIGAPSITRTRATEDGVWPPSLTAAHSIGEGIWSLAEDSGFPNAFVVKHCFRMSGV